MTSPNAPQSGRYPAGSAAFPHRHLTGLAGLAPWEILFLLDEAEQWVELNRQPQKRADRLAGLTIINAFFENSTRTLLSFEIAGKRLGADVVNMQVAQSSVKKGETLIDTAMTLNAMHADAMVIRHQSSGAVGLIANVHGSEAYNRAGQAVWALREAIERESRPDPLSQAINEGDGAYRP